YGDQLISFLDGNVYLFPEEEQQKFFYLLTMTYLFLVRGSIDKEIEVTTHKKGKVTQKEIQNIVSKQIKRFHDSFEKLASLPIVSQNYAQETLLKYNKILNKTIKEAFTKLPISPQSLEQLKRFCVNLFIKDFNPPIYSGVVIAGFGTKDIYPALVSYRIEGMV